MQRLEVSGAVDHIGVVRRQRQDEKTRKNTEQLLDSLMEKRRYWNLKRKYYMALSGWLAWEEATDLSQERLCDEFTS